MYYVFLSIPTEVLAYTNAHFGQAQLPILLDDVSCTGSESRLVDCPYDSNTGDCSHSQDAGTRCHPSMFEYIQHTATFPHTHRLSQCLFHPVAVPTNVSLNTPVTGTANNGEVKYYNFPFHSSGITFRLDVFQGSIDAFASYTTDAPNTQRGYNWTVQATIYDDLFFSPAPGSTVYVALHGIQSSNSFRVGVVMQDFTTTGKIIVLVIGCMINECVLCSKDSTF